MPFKKQNISTECEKCDKFMNGLPPVCIKGICPCLCHQPKSGERDYDWKDKLYDLSEKYCKHDDGDLNSCIYHIVEPFINDLLIKILAEIESCGSARDCRHILKWYILDEKGKNNKSA